MTFSDFVTHVSLYHDRHPEQRYGQACMNSLYWVRPDLHKVIKTDVFYVESQTVEDLLKMVVFWEELEVLW